MLLARGVLYLNNEHVLRKPAFLARLPACDAQSVAFLAQQRIAAVAGTEAPDAEFLGEMHDVAPPGIEFADRVHPLYEFALALDTIKRLRTHACHQVHIHRNVGAVGSPRSRKRAYGEPSGPMQYGITYITRPRMQPSNSPSSSRCASSGAIQLLLGPASSRSAVHMKVRFSTRATSEGSERCR